MKEDYYFQMFYDDLPIWGFVGRLEKISKPHGTEYRYYLFTHGARTPEQAMLSGVIGSTVTMLQQMSCESMAAPCVYMPTGFLIRWLMHTCKRPDMQTWPGCR